MTKKAHTPETDILIESKGKVESFFDKYGRKLMWGLVAITIVAVGIFVWRSISESNKAQAEMEAAQKFSNVVLTADNSFDIDYAATAEAYMAIAKEYEETAAGNSSYFMAASNYLLANDLVNAKAAIEKFQDVEGDLGQHMNAMALTIKGDIAVEENDYQSAASYFEKALAASKNSDIYGQNAMKLGLVYEAMGDEAKAQKVYKTAIEKHSTLVAMFAKYIKE